MNASVRKADWYLVGTFVTGVVMVGSPLIGLLGTMGGMVGAFEWMGMNGVLDPHIISEKVGEVLIATATGLGVAVLGLPIFVTFLVLYIRERRRLARQLAAPVEPPPPATD